MLLSPTLYSMLADRPIKANEYIKKALGSPTPEEHEKVVAENKRLQAELEAAREQITELQQASVPETAEGQMNVHE